VRRLKESGDYFGVHCHPVRWSDERRLWIHDFADSSWNVDCVKFALAAYATWSGAAAKRFRGGAGFLSNNVVEALDQSGVEVELSLEPLGARPFTEVGSAIDSSPYVGSHPDCLSAPQVAYRPAREDFRVPRKTGRNLIILPMATYSRAPWRPLWKRLLTRGPEPEVRILHMAYPWPSASYYWNLANRQISSMRCPYLSIALRTDAPDSAPLINTRKVLDGLMEHPIVEQLEFLDPLDVAPRLV
jgi:hypothetical protein